MEVEGGPSPLQAVGGGVEEVVGARSRRSQAGEVAEGVLGETWPPGLAREVGVGAVLGEAWSPGLAREVEGVLGKEWSPGQAKEVGVEGVLGEETWILGLAMEVEGVLGETQLPGLAGKVGVKGAQGCNWGGAVRVGVGGVLAAGGLSPHWDSGGQLGAGGQELRPAADPPCQPWEQ